MPEKKDERTIEDLIDILFEEEDEEELAAAAGRLLELEPGNEIARYVKWEALSDDEAMERADDLEEACASFGRKVEALGADSPDGERYCSLLAAMLLSLTSVKFEAGDKDAALTYAQRFMDADDSGSIAGRVMYYALLIEKGLYARAVIAADEDIVETAVGMHARAIAILAEEGEGEDAADAVFEALLRYPEITLCVVGLGELEDELEDFRELLEDGKWEERRESEEFEEAEDQLMQIAVITELWGASEERLSFFCTLVFAFGYISGRIGEDREDLDMLEKGYRTLGCLEEMRSARREAADLAVRGDQSAADEKAIELFKGMVADGLFGEE